MPTEEEQHETVNRNFTNHPPSDPLIGQLLDSTTDLYIAMAASMVAVLPDGREKSLVMTNLEQASMWSKAAVARNQQVLIDRFAEAPDYSD